MLEIQCAIQQIIRGNEKGVDSSHNVTVKIDGWNRQLSPARIWTVFILCQLNERRSSYTEILKGNRKQENNRRPYDSYCVSRNEPWNFSKLIKKTADSETQSSKLL